MFDNVSLVVTQQLKRSLSGCYMLKCHRAKNKLLTKQECLDAQLVKFEDTLTADCTVPAGGADTCCSHHA